MRPKIIKLVLIISMLCLAFLSAKECILSSENYYKILMSIFFLFFLYEAMKIYSIKTK
jgi:hypothetical protein